MIVRNKIWEEMKQAHANVLCIQWYTDKQRKYERYYQIFIALVASGGAFGYLFNSIIPWITSVAIAFVAVAKSLFPNFLQSEKELLALDGLMDYYNDYMCELEHLFYQFDNNIVDEKSAEENLFKLKKGECGKESSLNRLIRSIPSRRMKKNIEQSEEYLNAVYLGNYEQ